MNRIEFMEHLRNGECSDCTGTASDCADCMKDVFDEYETTIRVDERNEMLEDYPIHESELHEILQDIVYAQMMINRTVSRLNRHFNGTHNTKKGKQT